VTPGGGWAGPYSLGGNFSGDPIVANDADGRLEAFAVDASGLVEHTGQLVVNGGWSAWASLAGIAAGSQPGTGANRDGRLEVLDRLTDGTIWHNWEKSPNGGF
jgi:hypothetical protein